MIPRFAVAAIAALVAGQPGTTLADAYGDLLVLHVTAQSAAALAAGNHCAGLELRPVVDATRGFLESMDAGDGSPGSRLHDETLNLLLSIRYDSEPCDTPCPPVADATASVSTAQSGIAKYTLALDAVVDRWQQRAESDPPRLTLATARHSYDPLPRYAPGEPVAYRVNVGAACHGAVLSLGRDYELPGGFEGGGSFVPAGVGLWTIHLRRRDGLLQSPLMYLDVDTGLPTYFSEFWVSAEPVALMGPTRPGPWSRPTQPIRPLP